MSCDVSGEQLWSWIDRDAPELEGHLTVCPECRARAAKIKEEIGFLAGDAPQEIPLPDKIGPYAIRRLIGEGGQALVYEAEQSSPQRLVALKLLKGGQLVDKARLRLFHREIRSLGRLNHPAIATIYEAGRSPEGLHYFVMELVEGAPLHSFVKEKKPSRKEILGIFEKLCRAVQYAHEQGVIHRDLKPSNVMIKPDGELKILDFGLARVTQGDAGASLTATIEGQVQGTPRYMSPEQMLGTLEEIDHRTDVYALGVMLYELMTGTPPTRVTTVSPATIKTICEQIPTVPSRIDSSLRGELDAIVMKALEKKREDRYQSAGELADDISRYLKDKPIRARRPNALYFLRKKVTRRAPSLLTALVIVLAAVGLGYKVWRPTATEYDPLSDRMALLQAHRDLLRDHPTAVALDHAQAVPQLYPDLPEAILVNAQGYEIQGKFWDADALLTRAAARTPSEWTYGYLLEENQSSRYATGGASRANSHWRTDLAASADGWYMRSFATLNIDSALAWARQAVRLEPGHLLAHAAIAYISDIKNDTDGFLAASGTLIRRGYQPEYWLRERAVLLTRLGRFDEALAECNTMIARWPNDYSIYGLRGRIERRAEKYADADRDFSTQIETRSGNRYERGWLYFHRGTLRWLLGRDDDAIADYKTAHEYLRHPTFGSARLFILLREDGRNAEAEEILAYARTLVVEDPWLSDVFECLGGVLAPGDLVAIADSRGDAVAVCEGYYYAAESALHAGRIDEARRWFRKCIETGVKCDPQNPLESQSEFQLAQMRLSRIEETSATGTRDNEAER